MSPPCLTKNSEAGEKSGLRRTSAKKKSGTLRVKLKEPVVEYLNCSNEIFILLVEHHLETFAYKVSFESKVNSMTFGIVSLHRVGTYFHPV